MSQSISRVLLMVVAVVLSHVSVAQECGVIYCSSAGVAGAAATKQDPTDIITGMSLVSSTNSRVYLQQGTYVLTSALTMISNVSLVGGFDQNWNKSNSALTTIFRDPSNFQVGPPRLIGIECTSVSNFRLQDLTIQTSNALGQGTTTYGIYLRNCADYDITRCRVIAGNGGNGNFGTPGIIGMPGAVGEMGQPGEEDDAGNNAGGIGGSGSFTGSNGGGAGGTGGIRGTYEFPAGGEAFPGLQGEQGIGLFGGFSGVGGLEIFTTVISIACDRTEANDGSPGTDGGVGIPGFNGIDGQWANFGGYFNSGAGTDGTDGTNGSGGGGGGGGGSQGGITWLYIPWPIEDTIPENTNGSGTGGSGGGEGGQMGFGGQGGQGGGGSFAIYTYDNGFNGVLKDCELQSGLIGFGGAGGPGGPGGQGGGGGAATGLNTNCDIGAGGAGGDGGDGGPGGSGGRGSDGITMELYEDEQGEPLVLQNIYGLSQPLVTVDYSGCTDSPVMFSVDGSGTAQWFFGAGADPYSLTGLASVSSYTTLGDKTFTLVLNGVAYTYTDFLEIRQNAPTAAPQINTTTIDLCEGDLGNFTSSVAADNYIWQLSTEADTVEFNGPGFQILSTYVFDTAATYQLTLQTETNCCGISFSDTVIIVVDSIITPSLEVQSDLTGSGVGCASANVTFTAAAQDVGSSASYQWTVNGANVGLDQPVFTTNTLVDGDQVNCTVTSALGCATGLTAEGQPITISLIPPPEVSCQIDSLTAGDPTHYVATITSAGLPPYEYFWTFGDGTFGFGEDIYHIYDDGGLYTINLTVVDSNGCEATCQQQIDVSSFFEVDFNINGIPLDSMSGCAPLVIQFENSSVNAVNYFWDFGDGDFSADQEPTHTFSTTGLFSVTLWGYAANGTDSASVQNLIQVLPAPIASFIPVEVNPEEGADTVQFADNSMGATSVFWDFGDPTSGGLNTSTDNNPIHVFNTNGSFLVTLVATNQWGCTDTISIPHGVNVSIDEFSATNFQIYPNPSDGHISALMNKGLKIGTVIKIKDALGRIVKTVDFSEARSESEKLEIDLSGLNSGTYFLSVIVDDNPEFLPIIIQTQVGK